MTADAVAEAWAEFADEVRREAIEDLRGRISSPPANPTAKARAAILAAHEEACVWCEENADCDNPACDEPHICPRRTELERLLV